MQALTNTGMSGSDRRAAPRVSLDGDAIVFLGSQRVPVRAVNVGGGGMAVAAPMEQSPGQFLRVNFHLDGSSRMYDADAILVRNHPHGGEHIWGLMFQALDPKLQSKVEAFVRDGPQAVRSGPHIQASTPPSPAQTRRVIASEPPPPTRMTATARRAAAAEPPPPSRMTAAPRRAAAAEPPPPARMTATTRKDTKPAREKTAKERHRERMEALRTQRELLSLYRDAVKDVKKK